MIFPDLNVAEAPTEASAASKAVTTTETMTATEAVTATEATTETAAAAAGEAIVAKTGEQISTILLPKFVGIAVFDQANTGA